MMENQPWPAKYQQSGAGIDTTQDSLNNGEDEDAAKDQNGEGAHDEAQDESDSPNISEKAKKLIALILDQMKELSNAEKYLLYLKLFQISNVVDPLRQPLNPLGSRSEINRTISWIKTHLEEDAETSLPKQEVYEEYTVYCSQNQIKSLSQADFGKVMKQVYPKVRARRLGTRGNSRYCYSGLRRCLKLKPPKLPDLGDKPLSTEAPCTQSTLTAAAWLIVKEWSEFHFKVQFPSLQTLARFLVISHSVGVGSDAANQLTSATESQLKGEQCGKTGTKHREMQIQLQRKIKQNHEVKERKRKMQSPKCDPKPSSTSKKSRSALARLDEASPTLTGAGGESSTSTSTGSTSTSPTQGKPICDKSLDFTQLPALPDFKSFQKPVCEQPLQQQQNGLAAKVAIPRLASSGLKAQQQQRSPLSSPKKQVKNAKYKTIQPKPQPCDNASYNPQLAADIRSQGVLHNVDRFKERKCSDDDSDAPVFPLPRERLDSISNVDKDAMDEYLGTNNSQHEEELSKYFSNNIETADHDNTTKISQLRQLLEQNGISENKNFLIDNSPTVAPTNSLIDPLAVQNVAIYPRSTHPNPSNVLTHPTSNARRRVSFETPFHEDTVPPSPNTRRKNFSFTPISPGPQSPNGRQSKCSSTNVSPFVSPRNTPVPRSKNSTHQNAGIGVRKKIKREPDLSVDIPESKNYMSAPASPMLYNTTTKSVLEKLLHSHSKVAYTPDYITSIKPDVGGEVDLLENENVDNFSDFTSRSQSVPINQMIKSDFSDEAPLLPTLSNQNADFNDFDPISESVAVTRIINALDEQQCENADNIDMYNVDLTQNNQCIPGFNLIVDNNLEIQNSFGENLGYTPGSRHLVRSQSIDVNSCYDIKASNPSRSVPNTPLSFNKPQPVKNFNNQSSRSYPSTPLLMPETAFNYTVNGDCLLNGQPIRSNGTARDPSLTYFMMSEANEDNNIDRHLTTEEEFSIGRGLQGNEFGIVENDNALMDENGVLIGEQNYN